MIKALPRCDWFLWLKADQPWCLANADLPGLQFVVAAGDLAVQYHISHVPCLPGAIQAEHNLAAQATLSTTILPYENSGLLRDYQQADLARLKNHAGALLAYQMRLGKTATACHLHNPNDGMLLVVGPLAAREAWRDWIERTTSAPPFLLYGRRDAEDVAEPGYHAYFCHYDVLDAHTKFLLSQGAIGTLVCDELHMLQARGTQRLSAVNALAFRAKKILGLTGTPMWNKPKSLWCLLNLLSPGAWGTQFSFRQRYAAAQPGSHGWTYEGASNIDELQARLQTIMVRRTWQDVMPELPPTTRVIEPVEISNANYVAIEAATMQASLAVGTANQAGYTAKLRRKLAEVKVKAAKGIAERAADDGHKVVLWVWHNEIGEKVAAALTPKQPAFRLQASDNKPKRDAIVDAFRVHDGPAYLVASMGVGGVGLDLSCSDYAIFVELDWTPAVVQQAEMRTFHKDRPHVVVYLQADAPIELAVIEALDVKNDFAAAAGLGATDITMRVFTQTA